MIKHSTGLALLGALAAGCAAPDGRHIPTHPSFLDISPREYEPPRADAHRVLLDGRIPAYIGEDRAAPAFKLTLLFRTGTWLDPAGKEGLAEAAAHLLRHGGTASRTPEAVDRELENKAIEISATAHQDELRITVWSLSRMLEDALDLVEDMIANPRFDAGRIELWRDQAMQALRARHDRPDEILRLYWRDLLWGKEHTIGRRSSRASIEAITRDDLVAWHRAWIRPGNLMVVSTCDMPADELTAALSRRMAPYRGEASPWPRLPDPAPPRPPGVYVFAREAAQGAVRLGHLGIRYDAPDTHALMILSEALGGGSFQSRLTARVRVQEGLTYGIAVHVVPGRLFPGTTIVQFSSGLENVLRAVKLTVEEITRLHADGLEDDELARTKETMIARFAGFFEDLHGSLTGTALLEYHGRPADFYTTYTRRIREVTRAQVNTAARRFLRPDELRILIAGPMDAIRRGGESAGLRLEDFGPATEVPMRDPMTDEAAP